MKKCVHLIDLCLLVIIVYKDVFGKGGSLY